jgi:hypothetical protein
MKKMYVSTALLVFGLALWFAAAPMAIAQTPPDQTAKQETAVVAAIAQTQTDRARAAQAEMDAQRAMEELLIKTYTLKYVSPSEVLAVARPYVFDSTGSNNVLTVRIQRKYIPEFEALLKKLDVEKKNILFQVYTIIASKESFREGLVPSNLKPNQDIENKELNRAMTELKNMWNFKYYLVDDPSFLAVKEGMGSNKCRLVSKFGDFNLDLLQIQIIGDEPGKRTVGAQQLLLTQNSDQQKTTLINTNNISFKEKGFLVVGVSGLEGFYRGNALILVMSADIK